MTRADFNDFVRRVSRKLYLQSYNILRDRQAAEDAVQEVFIRLWNMNNRLSEYNSIEALASSITRNYCIDQIRKESKQDKDYESTFLTLQSDYPSPYEIIVGDETNSILEEILRKMSGMYRDVVQLRDIEGLSYEEIALKTGQNISTIRVNLSRARKIIRNELNKYQHEKR